MQKKKSGKVLDQIAEDAQETKLPSNAKLKQLGKMCNRLATLEDEQLAAQEVLSKINAELLELGTRKIPDLFDEFGLSELCLTDGTEISIKLSYAATITKDNQAECYKWLRANKFGTLIKHEIVTKLKKGENKEAKAIIGLAKKLGVTFEDKETVHSGTLRAFVKEQIEDGRDFPQELFKVFPIRQAKVKVGSF